MILKERIEELKNFIMKTNGDASPEANKVILIEYLKTWEKDTRIQLGMPENPEGTIGISFDESIELKMMPQWADVSPGFYESKFGLRIEVQRQSQKDGSVVFITICGEEMGDLEAMSYGIFSKLFEKITPKF